MCTTTTNSNYYLGLLFLAYFQNSQARLGSFLHFMVKKKGLSISTETESDPCLGSYPTGDSVINPAVDCHYFLPDQWLVVIFPDQQHHCP